jgi:hypothetical protein
MTLDDLLVEGGHIVPFHRRADRHGDGADTATSCSFRVIPRSPVRRRWETWTACGDREGAWSYACPMHP